MTFVDGVLATAVLSGPVLNAAADWWWADPLAGHVPVFLCGTRARATLTDRR